MANLYVKRIDTGETVRTIDLRGRKGDAAEKVVMGLLRNMDRETYFVDDDEVEED